MRWIAVLVTVPRRAWLVVLGVCAAAASLGYAATDLASEDDILAFLPRSSPEVRDFFRINALFGSTDVALVGIEAEDVFDADFLRRLRTVTAKLEDLPALGSVLSLANVNDFTLDGEHGGVVAAPLVDTLPESAAERAALREKVMQRQHIVGNLVSEDSRAVLLYCYLNHSADQRQVTRTIRKTVRTAFARDAISWSGAPFIASYVFDTTERDLARLVPWALGLIMAIMLIAFRDLLGTLLALLTTGLGVVMTLGLMALSGVAFNLVLSAMPVILCAVGSAFGVHVLARFYALASAHDRGTALRLTLARTGPVVLTAGLTTATSLLSFVFMDIQPVSTFGLFSAIGVALTAVLAITFLPALLRVASLPPRQPAGGWLANLARAWVTLGVRHRVPVGLVVMGAVGLGAAGLPAVDSTVDQSTFFAAGSPPDQAADFMHRRFGGNQFVQVHIEGDFEDPRVLRELRYFAARLTQLPGVHHVQSIDRVLSQYNEAMAGQRRIPDARRQVQTLYAFADSEPFTKQLLTRDHRHALVHAKLALRDPHAVQALVGQIESLAVGLERVDARLRGAQKRPARASNAIQQPRESGSLAPPSARIDGADDAKALRRMLLAWHIRSLWPRYDVSPRPEVGRIAEFLRAPRGSPRPESVRAAIIAFLRSDACVLDLAQRPEADLRRLAAAVAELGPSFADAELAIAVASAWELEPKSRTVDDLTFSLSVPLREIWRRERARRRAHRLLEHLQQRVPEPAEGFRKHLADSLWDLKVAPAAAPEPPGEAWSPKAGAPAASEGSGWDPLTASEVPVPETTPTRADAAVAVRRAPGVEADVGSQGSARAAERPPDDAAAAAHAAAASKSLTARVSGLPVMHRGLSESVVRNQWQSMTFAVVVVAVILAVVFRSVWVGLLGTVPTVATLLLTYGGMGALGVHLDIGTSMLASIVTGIGVDYAVHLLAAWRAPPGGEVLSAARTAGEASGPSIVVSAVMVAAGFGVLTLGEAKPLQNVGGLTAAAMLLAAAATCFGIPVLARKTVYRKEMTQ